MSRQKKSKFLSSLGFSAIVIISSLSSQIGLFTGTGYGASIVTIDVKTAHEATKDLKSPLIDVREVSEFQEVAPMHGRNMPLSTFNPNSFGTTVGVSKSDVLYIICRSGTRSMKAAKQLEAAGYTKIFNVSGGMLAWQSSGLPLKQN